MAAVVAEKMDVTSSSVAAVDSVRNKSLEEHRKKLFEHREVESRLKESEFHSFINLLSMVDCD
jgi:hypothetical protein